MQTLKWYIVFVLTAVGVFAAVLFFNSKTEPAYIAKVHAQNEALSVHPATQPMMVGMPANPRHDVASHKVKNSNL